MRGALGLVTLLFLLACAAEPDQPGGVTPDEARQLNEAAAMLDNDSMAASSPDNVSGR